MRIPKPYGPRGVAMLFFAILAFGRAVAYLQPQSPDFTPAILLEWHIPVAFWGFLWAATGLNLTVMAFRTRHAMALSALAGMSTLWAFIYIYAAGTRTLIDGAEAATGSWITASVYLSLAVIVICSSKMINPGPKLKEAIEDELTGEG